MTMAHLLLPCVIVTNSGPIGPNEIDALSSSLGVVNWNGDASPPLASPFFLG